MLLKENLLIEARDGLRGAEDGTAERITLPELLGENLVDQVVRIVLVHLDLFEDDALLACDVFAGKGGMKDEVGEDVERGLSLLFKHLDVEADIFLAGEGIQVAAHAVDLAGDLLGGAGGGALEDHVLDKVGDAVALGRLIPRSTGNPDTHGKAVHVRHPLGKDEHAVGQNGTADIAGGRAYGSAFRAERFNRGSHSGHGTPWYLFFHRVCTLRRRRRPEDEARR